ncbi:MAG TPA: glycosyltransferase family 4 protein [Ignavibacteriaceae bacterium]|nr:glycosyltransferase family 4 protein [Ignavibacteriaceae bacterium]
MSDSKNRPMKILKLAPHPFYVDRGTPIDVLLVLRVLSERDDTIVDALVYNEGKNVNLPNVKIHRIPNLKILKNVRPGFSFKKILGTFLLFIKAWQLVKKNKYDIIHAGEESVFIAMFFNYIYKIPYIYDLDSSIAQQLVEKKPFLKIFASFFNWFEAKAIKGSVFNLPVCNSLAELCEKRGSKKTVTLHDISQLKNPGAESKGALKKELGINKLILLCVGNLESYQGIDLLLESFAITSKKKDIIDLVIIGGVVEDIEFYSGKTKTLGIDKRVHFLGPKPLDKLDEYLTEADIIACPRIKGINTPMKLFPYLHSGKPVIATDLITHNQIISKNEAYLAPATPEGFSDGIITLIENENLRKELGKRGMAFVEKNHTYSAHKKRLNEVYNGIRYEVLKLSLKTSLLIYKGIYSLNNIEELIT